MFLKSQILKASKISGPFLYGKYSISFMQDSNTGWQKRPLSQHPNMDVLDAREHPRYLPVAGPQDKGKKLQVTHPTLEGQAGEEATYTRTNTQARTPDSCPISAALTARLTAVSEL